MNRKQENIEWAREIRREKLAYKADTVRCQLDRREKKAKDAKKSTVGIRAGRENFERNLKGK